MFRKSVFIMLFVCLLAMSSVAMAYPWSNQLEWRGTAGDANWYNAANWNKEGDLNCPADGTGPGPDFYCAVLPNQPGPRISNQSNNGNATCSMLSLNPWDPTPWGGQDVNVIIDATAGDVNFGAAIQISSQTDYDSYLGTTNLVSRAIINVYGGTVHTDLNGGTGNTTGITVGGGSSNFGMSYGQLNIYGGEVNVPRVVLNFGEIGLYGGTLKICTDSNFSVNTAHPGAALNKIKINGGTFIVAGQHEPDINTLRAGGFVVCERGTLRDPLYDAGTNMTTLVADINYCTWNPQPANNATNVHYYRSDGNSITLSWRPTTLDDIDVNHDVYFGTSFADVNTAIKTTAGIYMGSLSDPCDPCSYVVKDPNKFLLNTSYYWRVDEYSNSGSNFKKGLVWTFKTHDGRAYNPKPVNDANTKALSEPLQLSWTAGDWTQPANGHRVFFGTLYSAVDNATINSTDGRYRGTVSDPVYPLSRLMEIGGKAPGASFVLTPGTTYYWRIDEVNGTTVVGNKGVTCSFTPAAYFNIDDFEDSQSTDDVNANWPAHYNPTGCDPGFFGDAGRILVRDSTGKYLRYSYSNNGEHKAVCFSEAKRPYSGSGTSFTGNGFYSPTPKALRIDYRGTAVNAADEIYDRMYVVIEDTAHNVSVYQNPDPAAQQVGNWTSWYTAIKDVCAVGNTNLEAITGFSIGFGLRCNESHPGGGDGNVMFDNIRLYAATCIPSYAQAQGLSADLDNDCDVDINDLDVFANDWLYTAVPQHSITTTVPHKAPVIWYKFNEAAGTTAADSASGYTADVCGVVIWEPTGGRNGAGCITLNTLASQNSHVEVRDPNTAFGFLSSNDGSISLSVWINADTSVGNTMNNSWESFFTVYDSTWAERTSFSIPWRWGDQRVWFQSQSGNTITGPVMPVNYFGGRWNHWAAIKDAGSNTMLVYGNGSLVGTATGANTPLFTLPVQSIRIGMRGQSNANWGKWSGKVQDFKVYDYALDANEVAYDATNGNGVVGFIPLVSPANINKDGAASPLTDPNQKVNFGDIAIMGKQWHTQILWP